VKGWVVAVKGWVVVVILAMDLGLIYLVFLLVELVRYLAQL